VGKKEKKQNLKTEVLISIGKTVYGMRRVGPEEGKEGYDGKDLQKREVLSLE